MFGNPNISTTPVDDSMYHSQANVYGNSFANPMNAANMNPGWGMNSSLMTPSYTAGYRPQYSGPTGGAYFGRPGFFEGLGNLSPTSEDIPWGNPFIHQRPNVDAVSQRPMDGAMWGAQRIAAPALGFYAAGRMMGGFNSFGLARGAYTAGSRFAGGVGTGLAGSFGIRGAAARMLSAPLAAVGGIAAGFAAPWAVMQASMAGLSRTTFNPYMNTRRSADDLQSSFAGIGFLDASGHSVHGGGLGGYESSQMAGDITRQGIRDMAFSTGQYAEGASMIGRAGLMDNVGAKGITRRVKESMDQVKLIMSIANMPEMRDAVEQLAKLQQMGASVSGGAFSNASSTMTQIGKMAAVAGTSVQKLMNTVGAQGQYLYQANGMTPYLGQIAAANSYASFAAGNRMGLISSEQLSRMGGLDGATQASLTGQINVSQTLFNKMGNYNTYMGGGSSSSMIGTVNQFGRSMANNPLGTFGGMMLYGRQMAGAQMAERGSLAVEDQLMQIARNVPGMLDRNGKISIEKAVPFLMQMGMDEDQIHAFATQRISEQDSGVHALTMKNLDTDLAKQQRQYISQTGSYGGIIGGSIYSMRKAGRAVTESLANVTGIGAAGVTGTAADGINSLVDSLWFGSTIGKAGSQNIDDYLVGGKTSAPAQFLSGTRDGVNPFKLGLGKEFNDRVANSLTAERINSLAGKGNANAKAYLAATSPEEKRKYMNALIKNDLGDNDRGLYSSPEQYQGLEKFLNSRGRRTEDSTETTYDEMGNVIGTRDVVRNNPDLVSDFDKSLGEMSGVKGGRADQLRASGLAYKIAARMEGGDLSVTDDPDKLAKDADLQAYSKMTGQTDSIEAMKQAVKSGRKTVEEGYVGLSTAALRVDRSKFTNDDDMVREAARLNGGKVRGATLKNSGDKSDSEVIGFGRTEQEDSSMRTRIEDRYKNGSIDFSGYQTTINALDNKKTIDTFDKAVGRFVTAVDGMSSKGSPTPGSSLFSRFSDAWHGENQKTSNQAAGNGK